VKSCIAKDFAILATMAPKLEQVFKVQAFLSKEDMLPLGSIKGGPHRYVVPVVSGFIEGADFKAELTSGGSDWLLMDPATGTAQLDIRANARTKDGEYIYTYYHGILKMDQQVEKFLQWSPEAKSTKSSDHYFMTTPRYEVSSERLKWMEQNIFVGHGHFVVPGDGRQAVEYEIYKVVSG